MLDNVVQCLNRKDLDAVTARRIMDTAMYVPIYPEMPDHAVQLLGTTLLEVSRQSPEPPANPETGFVAGRNS